MTLICAIKEGFINELFACKKEFKSPITPHHISKKRG